MYQFSLFGRFEANWNNQPLDGFEARKVQELLCYLATFRSRSHPREALADMLWEGYSPASTRKNMRQTLWQLQSALKTSAQSTPVVLVDSDFLSLNTEADFSIDIAVFEAAADAVQNVSGYQLDTDQAEMLLDAVALYRADFLESWYNDWCLHERERFRDLFLIMLDKLICYYETRQEYETSLCLCNRALREEYVRERTHRQLMRLHYLRGDRTAALRQFERCKAALEEALGVSPGQRTRQLYECICNDDAAAVLLDASPGVLSSDTGDVLPEMLSHLMELKTALDGVQWQALRQLGQDTTS
jgi:DNA-binding SARP family transcriptional activator